MHAIAGAGGKIKTPFEHVVSCLRAVRGMTDGTSSVYTYLSRMGELNHQNPIPTGYSEIGGDWIDTNNLLDRQNFGVDMANRTATTFGADIMEVSELCPKFDVSDISIKTAALMIPDRALARRVVAAHLEQEVARRHLHQARQVAARPHLEGLVAVAHLPQAVDGAAGVTAVGVGEGGVGLRHEVHDEVGVVEPEMMRERGEVDLSPPPMPSLS